MPHHQRPARQERQQQPESRAERLSIVSPESIARDVRALNSSVLVLTQKMQYIVRNEKILGRNLLVLNKKIQELQSKQPESPLNAGVSSVEISGIQEQFEAFSAELSRLGRMLSELRDEVEEFRQNFVKSEELKELKYVIDTINPLEYVSFKQVDEIVEKKLKELFKKKK